MAVTDTPGPGQTGHPASTSPSLSPEKGELSNQQLDSGFTTAAASDEDTSGKHLAPPVKGEQDVSEHNSINDTDVEKQTDAAQAEGPPRDITGWKWALVVLSILSSTFLFALDNTIVADIQPAIVLHFNDIGKLTWLAVSFLLGAAATNLIWGKVFGQFNAKWMYIINVALFEIGSAICGAAPTMNALIVGRAICGIGGSGMYVGVMTLLAATTTIQERPMYIGGTGLTWGLGTVLGPIVGGGFSDSSAGWVSDYLQSSLG